MIRPSKHSHPDKTVIYASFLMLKELRKKRVVGYSDLFQLVKSKVTSGEFLFMPALNFLFLLGFFSLFLFFWACCGTLHTFSYQSNQDVKVPESATYDPKYRVD